MNLVRPAGLEPATFGSGARRKETAWGSGRPLPLILLAFCQTPDRPRRPRAATECLPFVSRKSASRAILRLAPSPRAGACGEFLADVRPVVQRTRIKVRAVRPCERSSL